MSLVSTLKLDPNQLEWVELAIKNMRETIASLFERVNNELQGASTTTQVITACSLFGSLYYWHRYSFWSRRNIKNPTPIPPFGNFLSFIWYSRATKLRNWRDRYGKLHGIYVGAEPQLICSDANVLKKICIKDFDKFPNHFMVGVKNKYQKKFLIFQEDNYWRALRALLTPTFTSGKMKIMYKKLDICAEKLLEGVRNSLESTDGHNEVTKDLRRLFGSLSMSSALSSFYGVSLDDNNDESKTVAGFETRSQTALRLGWTRFILHQLLPLKMLKFLDIPLIGSKQMDFFADNAKRILALRRKLKDDNHNDYLHLLIQAKLDSELEIADSDKMEQHHALLEDDSGNTGISTDFRPSKMRLTEEEVTCQMMMFMMVATETTATMLTHTVYLLAEHQQIQQRLYEEVSNVSVFDESTKSYKFDYEQLTCCQYLDCVLSESLRLMGPAISLDRIASEDYYVEEYNVTIPKGTIIHLAFQTIHMDSDYWPEPDKYDPERFMPENKKNIVPGSYCPFGIGPRSCIGYRFALTEGKVALAKLISEFSFHRPSDTVYPPKSAHLSLVINEHENLKVILRSRK